MDTDGHGLGKKIVSGMIGKGMGTKILIKAER